MPQPLERRANAGDLLTPVGAVAPAAGAAVVLPKTATDAELKLVAGLVLLALSLLLALRRRPLRHSAH